MNSNEARYQEKLKPFLFGAFDDPRHEDQLALEGLGAGLPPVLELDGVASARISVSLAEREGAVHRGLGELYARRNKELARTNLEVGHSFEILFARSRLLDALHRFAFEVAVEDLPALIRLLVINGERELEASKAQLPGKAQSLEKRRAERTRQLESAGLSEQERAYYAQLEENLATEVRRHKEAIAGLEASLPVWNGYAVEREALERRIVMFARGGYGRAEMSFSSDVDTGWCVDTRQLAAGEVAIFQEIVMRAESLLKGAGVETAHQYFETEEDLSRFMVPETIHTAPAILESRAILGSASILAELKSRFMESLPYEEFLKKKISEYQGQPRPSLTEMDLKEDKGGLRSIQIPLWIYGVTRGADSYLTADLIGRAREDGLLSLWEASRLLLALELLYDLRNFLGMAEQSYYDEEARAGNFNIPEFPPNRLNDGLARLYLFRKHRFASLDAFDTYRLRLASDVERISAALLGKILDRTISHDLGDLRVLVHLGRREITTIEPLGGNASAGLPEMLGDGAAMLELSAFIARTDYDLSAALKDALSEVVASVVPADDEAGRAGQARRFEALMLAPYAHRALATMFEIYDPLAPGLDTLLGRFMPEYDRVVFLVRHAKSLTVPVHTHLVECVANGQQSLDWLKANYHELHALLLPGHVLALKWSLFLHGLGKLAEAGEPASRSAEQAADLLARLGFQDEELERQVRLLVEHHDTMVRINRTATYLDEALVQFFEVAGREMATVVLLFLVNRSILMAGGFHWGEVGNLNRFFDEISRILAAASGVPDSSRSLEIVNAYLYEKKEELEAETRVCLLLRKGLAAGMEEAVYAPLRKASAADWKRLRAVAPELDEMHRSYVLGAPEGGEQDKLQSKMMLHLRNNLSGKSISRLTRQENEVFTWFFSAFPNRYLLAASAHMLAEQLENFAGFKTEQVLADVVSAAGGESEGLLVYTRELPGSHSRVAYMLSRKRINIISGKVNRVAFPRGKHGYCYYFQISPMAEGTRLFPRDLEGMILGEAAPELEMPPLAEGYPSRGGKVEFLGDDGKGYQVRQARGAFSRESAPYKVLRVVLRDEPFLFYKVTRAFGLYEVEIQQSLITTTGNQVLDYFYLLPEDYERLRASSFQERFLGIVQAPLV